MSRTLLELSRAHATGQLDGHRYRAQRRQLIRQQLQGADDATQPGGQEHSGEATTEATRELTRELVRAITRDNTRDFTRDFSPSAAAALKSRPVSGLRPAWIAAAALVCLVSAAAAAWLWSERQAPSATATAPTASQASAPASALSPLAKELAALLAEGEPSPVDIERYLERWERSSGKERATVAANHDYRQLIGLIDGRIRVEEALDPNGVDAEVSAHIHDLKVLRRRLAE